MSFAFVQTVAQKAAQEIGLGGVLTPVMHIEIRNLQQRERFYALVDSGADYSFIPHEAAQILGIEPKALAGPTVTNRGIGGEVESKFAILDVAILGKRGEEEKVFELPFLVPISDAEGSEVILVGRHPFFDMFNIWFRMGYTDNPALGKWVIEEVRKRRDSRKYRNPGPMPQPPRH